jgi:hypothetical protein
MSDDYFGTAQVMQRDSRCLHDNQRWHNACYLAGYVVECSLKAVAKADGMTQQQLSRRPYGHNLTELAPLTRLVPLVTASRLFTDCRGLLFDSSKITDSLLYSTWNPFDRYQPTLWDDENTSQQFQETAQYLSDFLNELRLNGTL